MQQVVTTWNAGEADAYRLFSQWTRDEALSIAAWNAASVRGEVIGERPVSTPHEELQRRARESVQ